MTKRTYMIAHGASVVVVRDGKRVPVPAGGGAEFTEDEIASINRSAPGALRKPVSEIPLQTEDDEDDAPKAKKAKKAEKPAPAAPTAAEDAASKKAAASEDDDI